MYKDLAEKVAIVTGGGSGIGKAIVLALAEEGVFVVIVGRNPERINKVAADIESARGHALAIAADVTRSDEVAQMAKTVLAKFERIDILVNNAGGSARKDASFFHESEEEIWDAVIDVNLKGTLLCTKAVISHMIERRQGKIVNIASIVGQDGRYGMADYAAAKGAVISFTKSLAQEVGGYGINANCVAPGIIETEHARSTRKEIEKTPFRGAIPLERKGTPEDIAAVVLFLVSGQSKYITGECIRVSGGL